MMSLPEFTDPNPTREWLFAEQERLQHQADKMMTETAVLELIGAFGNLGAIEGSYRYGTMIYPDLDVSVVSDAASKDHFAELLGELAKTSYVRRVSGVDTNFFSTLRHKRPKGYWIGIEIPFEGDRWGIDCWLQRPEWVEGSGRDYTDDLKDMTEDQLYAILAIKYELIRSGRYGKDFLSTDVYDAVLEHGVASPEQFISLHS